MPSSYKRPSISGGDRAHGKRDGGDGEDEEEDEEEEEYEDEDYKGRVDVGALNAGTSGPATRLQIKSQPASHPLDVGDIITAQNSADATRQIKDAALEAGHNLVAASKSKTGHIRLLCSQHRYFHIGQCSVEVRALREQGQKFWRIAKAEWFHVCQSAAGVASNTVRLRTHSGRSSPSPKKMPSQTQRSLDRHRSNVSITSTPTPQPSATVTDPEGLPGLIRVFRSVPEAKELVDLAPDLFNKRMTAGLLRGLASCDEAVVEASIRDFGLEPGHRCLLRLVLSGLKRKHTVSTL